MGKCNVKFLGPFPVCIIISDIKENCWNNFPFFQNELFLYLSLLLLYVNNQGTMHKASLEGAEKVRQ